MSRRMDWRRARLHGRPTLDHRYEHDVPDRADRWLRVVERRQRERRTYVTTRRTAKAVTTGSSEVPW